MCGTSSFYSQERSPILFYHSHQPYYGFTNFSNHPVVYKEKKYPTSEHLYQSLKFEEHWPDLAEHIRTCSERPSVAFSEARRFQPEVRRDWKEVNIATMDLVLRLKFEQHDDLREELIGTGDALLVEDSDKDAFWGVGPDRKGRNELGHALMRLRKTFRCWNYAPLIYVPNRQSTMTSPTPNSIRGSESPMRTVQSHSHSVNVQSPVVHTVRVDFSQPSTQDTVQSPVHTSPRCGHNSHVRQSFIQPSSHPVTPSQSPIRVKQAPAHNAHVPVQITQIPVCKVRTPEQYRPPTEQNPAVAAHSSKQPNYNSIENISADLAAKCRIPDCEQPVYYDGTAKSDYCSQQHRQ
ncbi:hypothetical protein C0993_005466 [Termitomyces sp. T159_Od127]|nr:hypothetical protein C0993_005466 [Termitomyces sp. T159_Od127]